MGAGGNFKSGIRRGRAGESRSQLHQVRVGFGRFMRPRWPLK